MYMIELEKDCECGNRELTTHQQLEEPTLDEQDDVLYGYCSECGEELNGLVKDCKVYEE